MIDYKIGDTVNYRGIDCEIVSVREGQRYGLKRPCKDGSSYTTWATAFELRPDVQRVSAAQQVAAEQPAPQFTVGDRVDVRGGSVFAGYCGRVARVNGFENVDASLGHWYLVLLDNYGGQYVSFREGDLKLHETPEAEVVRLRRELAAAKQGLANICTILGAADDVPMAALEAAIERSAAAERELWGIVPFAGGTRSNRGSILAAVKEQCGQLAVTAKENARLTGSMRRIEEGLGDLREIVTGSRVIDMTVERRESPLDELVRCTREKLAGQEMAASVRGYNRALEDANRALRADMQQTGREQAEVLVALNKWCPQGGGVVAAARAACVKLVELESKLATLTGPVRGDEETVAAFYEEWAGNEWSALQRDAQRSWERAFRIAVNPRLRAVTADNGAALSTLNAALPVSYQGIRAAADAIAAELKRVSEVGAAASERARLVAECNQRIRADVAVTLGCDTDDASLKNGAAAAVAKVTMLERKARRTEKRWAAVRKLLGVDTAGTVAGAIRALLDRSDALLRLRAESVLTTRPGTRASIIVAAQAAGAHTVALHVSGPGDVIFFVELENEGDLAAVDRAIRDNLAAGMECDVVSTAGAVARYASARSLNDDMANVLISARIERETMPQTAARVVAERYRYSKEITGHIAEADKLREALTRADEKIATLTNAPRRAQELWDALIDCARTWPTRLHVRWDRVAKALSHYGIEPEQIEAELRVYAKERSDGYVQPATMIALDSKLASLGAPSSWTWMAMKPSGIERAEQRAAAAEARTLAVIAEREQIAAAGQKAKLDAERYLARAVELQQERDAARQQAGSSERTVSERLYERTTAVLREAGINAPLGGGPVYLGVKELLRQRDEARMERDTIQARFEGREAAVTDLRSERDQAQATVKHWQGATGHETPAKLIAERDIELSTSLATDAAFGSEAAIEDVAEAAYWRFDAAHPRLSERDAFKAEIRRALRCGDRSPNRARSLIERLSIAACDEAPGRYEKAALAVFNALVGRDCDTIPADPLEAVARELGVTDPDQLCGDALLNRVMELAAALRGIAVKAAVQKLRAATPAVSWARSTADMAAEIEALKRQLADREAGRWCSSTSEVVASLRDILDSREPVAIVAGHRRCGRLFISDVALATPPESPSVLTVKLTLRYYTTNLVVPRRGEGRAA